MIGLTGGIGSGKSVVARRLAELGAVIVDSDLIAREVVAPGTDGLREVVAAFGAGVCRPDGSLDRPALGAIVFGDEAARRRLEGIIHPRVRARSAELAAAAPADAIVVNDVPLLVEVGLAPTYHLVVVVETASRHRVERLVRDRGMTEAEAYARIDAQAGDEQRRAVADVVLCNDGSLADLHVAVDRLWRDRLLPYELNLRKRRPARGDDPGRDDPCRPTRYDRFAARIRHALRPAEVRVDHVGATAVPGLDAGDIDLQLTVASSAEADAFVDRLAAAGFPPAPDLWSPRSAGPLPAPERLHGSADPGQPARLHVRVAGSPGWRLALLVRDYLCADPAGAVDRHRRHWAAERDGTPESWWREELRAAEAWAARVGWRP
jgi:dephospho-CoA kinase